MPGSAKMSLARLCLNGVIKPIDYIMQKKLRSKRKSVVDHNGKPFDLAKYSSEECKLYFRFTQDEISKLVNVLSLNRTYVLRSRTKFSGKEGLCILLRRLSYPNRLCDLVKIFNRDISALSRIINFMLDMIYKNHARKLESFSKPWLGPAQLEEFAEACSDAGSHYPNIVGFIDGTIRSICRPTYNQRSFYSEYKRKHCVKYQSTVFPNGLIGRLDGPYIGRRHDSAILHISKILQEMNSLFVNRDGTHYAVYGDPGYSNQRFIKVGFKNHTRLNLQQQQFNQDMSALRVSVEYGFGQIYFVAAFVVNCQTCLRGNQISTYFNCAPPTLEEYLV